MATRSLTRRTRTLALMAAGIGAVVLTGIWDEQQQSARALDLLMRKYHLLALALVSGGEPSAGGSSHAAQPAQVTFATRALEREGGVVVLFKTGAEPGFVLSSGRSLEVAPLDHALSAGLPGVTLGRDTAARLGLPGRAAVAGLAQGASSPGIRAVAVIGTAAPERDRSRHDEWRTVLSVAMVSALILGFGLVALGQQRREMALEQRVRLQKTENERDAELAKANRMAVVAALASGIAHELGTPLGIISGRTEQLRTAFGADPSSSRLLDTISAQVERMDRVIRTFLSFARGEAPLLAQTRADALARTACNLVKHRYSSAEVDLRLDLGSVQDAWITCESSLFEQVLVNLLVNALEASVAGQEVVLSLARSGRLLAFDVTDEGTTISPTVIARVTEPFFTTKSHTGGTGLGLAIAKEIVSHYGGTLTIRRRCEFETPETSGTQVSVTVPVTPEPDHESRPPAAH